MSVTPTLGAALKAGRLITKTGRWASRKSLKADVLDAFELKSTEHLLAQLDLLLEAFTQHAQETGEPPSWLTALDSDPPLSQEELREALLPLKTTLLRVLRISHDPALGNEMLARVAAGLNRVPAAPEDIVARVLAVAPQLVSQDIFLMDRYLTEGIQRIESDQNCKPHIFTKKMIQDQRLLYFLDEQGQRSEPLDPYSYNAIKNHGLIMDQPWFHDPERPRGRPKFSPVPPPLGQPDHMPPFKIEWMPTLLGLVLMEGVHGKPWLAVYGDSQ